MGSRRPPELDDREWLVERYVGERLSVLGISALLGCHEKTVRKALVRNRIPMRKGIGPNGLTPGKSPDQMAVHALQGSQATREHFAKIKIREEKGV